MNRALEFWNWIKWVELRFGIKQIPISDYYVESLIMRLENIFPELKEKAKPKYKTMLNDDFINKFMIKVYTSKQRTMLFDFIKNLIHENLLENKKDLY